MFFLEKIGLQHYCKLLNAAVFTARSYTDLAVKIIITAGFLPHCTQPAFEPAVKHHHRRLNVVVKIPLVKLVSAVVKVN
jgi:hypothetical protein